MQCNAGHYNMILWSFYIFQSCFLSYLMLSYLFFIFILPCLFFSHLNCQLYYHTILYSAPTSLSTLLHYLRSLPLPSVFYSVSTPVARLKASAGALLFDLCTAAPDKMVSDLRTDEVWCCGASVYNQSSSVERDREGEESHLTLCDNLLPLPAFTQVSTSQFPELMCVLIAIEAINVVANMVSSTHVITHSLYLMVVWAGWRAFAVTCTGARGVRILWRTARPLAHDRRSADTLSPELPVMQRMEAAHSSTRLERRGGCGEAMCQGDMCTYYSISGKSHVWSSAVQVHRRACHTSIFL